MTLNKNDLQVLGSYTEIRAAAQDLDRNLWALLDEIERSDVASRARILAQDLAAITRLNQACALQVKKSLETIETTSQADPEQRSWAGDHSVHVQNEWLLATEKWPIAQASTDEAVDGFKKVSRHLDQIVFWCQSLTLTPRLAGILENVRIGKAIDIDSVMGHEFPRSADLRERLMREIVDQDGVLKCGYLDKDSALIFRVAESRGKQRWSIMRVLLAVMVGFVLVALACVASPGDSWPFERKNLIGELTKYAFLSAGALAHLVIQGVTLSRKAKHGLSRPWNDWITWLNAHETQAIWGVVSLLLGFFLLAFTMKDFAWQTAFFAGYSIDSIIDVLLDRFEQMASARSKKITEVVQGTTPRVATP